MSRFQDVCGVCAGIFSFKKYQLNGVTESLYFESR